MGQPPRPLSFFLAEEPAFTHEDRRCESRCFLRITPSSTRRLDWGTSLSKFCFLSLLTALALTLPSSAFPQNPGPCPDAVGTSVASPKELRSRNGRLQVRLWLRNSLDSTGQMQYCYVDEHGDRSPTLRLKPGDLLLLKLKNELSLPSSAPHPHSAAPSGCPSALMTTNTTNLHFHGLSLSPSCHADDSLHTSIPPFSKAFVYRVRIPNNQPPGLYWYHAHPHGHSEEQVLGGASGALIVEGIAAANPLVAGLPERVLVIRDREALSSRHAPPRTAIPVAQRKTCPSISSPFRILNIPCRISKRARSRANDGACSMPPPIPT